MAKFNLLFENHPKINGKLMVCLTTLKATKRLLASVRNHSNSFPCGAWRMEMVQCFSG